MCGLASIFIVYRGGPSYPGGRHAPGYPTAHVPVVGDVLRSGLSPVFPPGASVPKVLEFPLFDLQPAESSANVLFPPVSPSVQLLPPFDM